MNTGKRPRTRWWPSLRDGRNAVSPMELALLEALFDWILGWGLIAIAWAV